MNKDYVIYNDQGEILRVGNCPEEDLPQQMIPGENFLEAKADCVKDSVDPVTRKVIPGGRPNAPTQQTAPTPSTDLPVATQLDLLWQAMDAGTFPKAEPFYSAIKAQKDAQQ